MTTKIDLSAPGSASAPGTTSTNTPNRTYQARFEACLTPKTQSLPLTEVRGLAGLSLSAYDNSGAPTGWRRLNDDDDALTRLGLSKSLFDDNLPGGYATLFQSTSGDRHVLAFRGSDSAQDYFDDNIPQSRGRPTEQYEKAILLAKTVANASASPLTITGHSLGGGLAAAASVVSGMPAVTFNAAGLHPNTVEGEGYKLDAAATERITNYYFQHELLSAVQNNPLLDGVAALTATPLDYSENIARLLQDQTPHHWRLAYVPAAIGHQVSLNPVDQQGRLMADICQQRYDSFGLHSLQRIIDALDYCLDDFGRDHKPSPAPCVDSHMRY